MDISSVALQGLEQASSQLDAAAGAIAGVGAVNGTGAAPDTVSLSEEMVALMSAQQAASANIAVLRTADQVQHSLVNIFA